MPEAWRIPGDLLVVIHVGMPKKLVLTSGKKCYSNRMDEIASKSKDWQAKSHASSSVSLSLGCHQKVQPTFRMDFPALATLPEKHCHRDAQQLVLPLVPFVVKLTTKLASIEYA